jgi:hypothetical protein
MAHLHQRKEPLIRVALFFGENRWTLALHRKNIVLASEARVFSPRDILFELGLPSSGSDFPSSPPLITTSVVK